MGKRLRQQVLHQVFISEVDRLRRMLIGLGIQMEQGEDLLHDVYLEALKHPPEDRGTAQLARWFMRATFNRAQLEFRRKQVHQRGVQALDPSVKVVPSDPGHLAGQAEEAAILQNCLDQMEPDTRGPLVLRHCCDLNANEIGEILNLKPGTVRKRLCVARARLARLLLEQGIKS